MKVRFVVPIGLWVGSAAILVAGCGGGSSDSEATSSQKVGVSGAVQKGPFVVGTPVFVNKLEADGTPGEVTVLTEVNDSIGSFSFDISTPGAVQIVSNGYYFSELTGQISSGTLTLKAIYEVSTSNQQTAFVNVLTHLTNDRILKLIQTRGLTVRTATTQAQGELVAALNPVLPTTTMPDFSTLSIYNVNAQNQAGNGYLLALSTAFYKYGEIKWKKIQAEGGESSSDAQLALILNVIAKDFADDGAIQTEGFTADLTTALRSLNPTAVMQHLRERSEEDYSEPIAVPDISQYFGLCAGAADCAWEARAPMPQQIYGMASVLHSGKVFSIGGYSSQGTFSDSKVYAYDPALNEWTRRADFPSGGPDGNSAVETDGRLFVAVSEQGSIWLYEYDDDNDAWIRFMDVGASRGISGYPIAAHDGKLYFYGGYAVDPTVGGLRYQNNVDVLDVGTKRWTSLGHRDDARWPISACKHGDEILSFHYQESGGVAMIGLNAKTNTWTKRTAPVAFLNGTSCATAGNRLYLFGGYVQSGSDLDDGVSVYELTEDRWSLAPIRTPYPVAQAGAVGIGTKVWLFGGVPGSSTGNLSALDTTRLPE